MDSRDDLHTLATFAAQIENAGKCSSTEVLHTPVSHLQAIAVVPSAYMHISKSPRRGYS